MPLPGTDPGVVGDHCRQEALVQHCLRELQSSLRQRALSAGADQRVVGDHVFPDTLVQRCLEGFKGSLRKTALFPSTDQSVVNDRVWQKALGQHGLEERQALCGNMPLLQALVNAL